MKTPQVRILRYIALGALVVVAGCTQVRPATGQGATPASSAVLGTDAIDLVTHSGTWPKTQQTLDTALNRLDSGCMNRLGFEYPAVTASLLPAPEDDAATINLPNRRKRGYGITTKSPGSASAQPVDAYYEALSPQDQQRYDLAFFGPPGKGVNITIPGTGIVTTSQEGCEAESRRALAGDVITWARITYLPEALNDQLTAQVEASPDYLVATARWRSCMSARGFRYETPTTARDSLETRYQQTGPTPALRDQEISVAVADGECAIDAKVPSTALAIRRTLVSSLPLNDQKTLADLAANRTAAVRRAAAVIGHP